MNRVFIRIEDLKFEVIPRKTLTASKIIVSSPSKEIAVIGKRILFSY